MVARIGTEFLVNTLHTYGEQGQADIAGTADGDFVVTWRSQVRRDELPRSYSDIHARAFGTGRAIGDEFRVNLITDDAQLNPAITARPDGSFAIVYSSGEENHLPGTSVNTRIIGADGVPTGPELLTDYDYYHQNARIAAFADGRTVTVWSGEDEGEGEIRAADGTVVSSFVFGWDGRVKPKGLAALADGSFALLWYGQRDENDAQEGGLPAFYGQIRAADGSAGAIFEVGAAPGANPRPSIVQLSNGNILMVWQDDAIDADPAIDPDGTDIKARIFSPTGVPLGEAFTINTLAAGDQRDADVAALADGRFVVTWRDATSEPGEPSGGASIRAAVFGSDGQRLGEEFQVNTAALYDQDHPRVAWLGADRFAISWTDGSGDDVDIMDGGIKVQIFAVDALAPHAIGGTDAADRLTGTFANDMISGGNGGDTLFGGAGEDKLFGEKGEDKLYGGLHDDQLVGGWQSDELYGELGRDTLYGDLLAIGSGSRGGNDRLYGGDGADILYGDAKSIAAGGQGGRDALKGGSGDDRLYGDGETGAGVATGGGADTLDGGAGNDQLWGGGGNDRFIFNGLSGSDIIWDFGQSPGDDDLIDLRGTEAGDPRNGQLQVYYINGNAILEFNGGRITVMGVTHLDDSDVLVTYRNGGQSPFDPPAADRRLALMAQEIAAFGAPGAIETRGGGSMEASRLIEYFAG
jgi:Ca2+-binding RTX toxin-like protein